MDWDLCLICQKATKETIKCPLNALGCADLTTSYESFLKRVAMFRKLNRLPVPLEHLKEESTAQDFVENKASWHKSCHKKFDQDKLERARKRVGNEVQEINTKRIRLQHQSLDKSVCIFCEEETGDLHEFRTLVADTNIRNMATVLEEAALLAKIEGDLIALEAKHHLACLTKLRNRHRTLTREKQEAASIHCEEKKKQARAFAELVSYIENAV